MLQPPVTCGFFLNVEANATGLFFVCLFFSSLPNNVPIYFDVDTGILHPK